LLRQCSRILSKPSTVKISEEQLNSDCDGSRLRQLCPEALGVFVKLAQAILVPPEDFPHKALWCHFDDVPTPERPYRLHQSLIEQPTARHSPTTPNDRLKPIWVPVTWLSE